MPRRNHPHGSSTKKRKQWREQEVVESVESIQNRLFRAPSKRRDLLPMVQTAGICPTGKMRYGTSDDAKEALRRALINREILQSPVVEERWYPMPGDAPCICRGYHLTSAPRRAK